MNFEYAIRVLEDKIKSEGAWLEVSHREHFNKIEKRNIAELRQAISILRKTVVLDSLFKDAIVVGENVEVSK